MSISVHNDVSYPTHNNSYVVKALVQNRVWEKKITSLLTKYITPDDVVVDCGAYIGSHTLTMSALARRVYAFEPQPLAAECIERTLKAKKIDNVIFREVAVDSTTGQDFIHTNNDGDASLGGIRDHKFKSKFPCLTMPLDNLIPTTEKISFIKIDVEGAEWRVLEGAKNLIRKWRPTIIMETFNTKKNMTRLDQWIEDNDYEKEYISSANFLIKPKGGRNGKPVDVLLTPKKPKRLIIKKK